jgi:diaminopropionate ammonia-lyase
VVNAACAPELVSAPDPSATAFHRALEGYAPTPLRALDGVAAQLGIGALALKDESGRLGLPAFKVLGASWATQRALRERPDVTRLVAASAGNHGRAVAHVARMRGLEALVLLPARASAARRAAIEAEGARVVAVDGTYEEAVALARAAGAEPGSLELADVGADGPARWVIDGYGTLFAELAEQAPGGFDLLLVPAGVGSLAAAAARHAAATGAAAIAVEPRAAACVAASLAAGEPAVVPTPGTAMAGLDCAEVSAAAWPDLRAGLRGAIAVDDDEARAAMRELAALGLEIGDCGAAALAALRALATDDACAALREAVGFGPATRALLIATEGATDPGAYARTLAGR